MFQNTHKGFFFENGLYHIPERKYHSREKLENVLNSKETRKEIMLPKNGSNYLKPPFSETEKST